MPNRSDQPKVSVLMLAYNHEPYIAQALESALSQETRFDYEIVVGEDCSTDKTRALLKTFQARHPGKVRLLLHEQNLGAQENLARAWAECRGQYVAMLEGDDYWTSEHKLQMQVDFLDTHPECALCFHNAQMVYQDGAPPKLACPPDQKPLATVRDLLTGNFIPTCSVVYRGGLVPSLPAWMLQMSVGDWPLHLLHAEHGKIGYLNSVMATYRIHSQGMWSRLLGDQKAMNQHTIQIYEQLLSNLHPRYRRPIRRQIARRQMIVANLFLLEGDLAQARRYAGEALARAPFPEGYLSLAWPKFLLKLCIPIARSMAGRRHEARIRPARKAQEVPRR